MSTHRTKPGQIGHYVLGRCLGVGNFAQVFTATHEPTNKHVAIKIISKREMCKDPHEKMEEKVQREISILFSLNHPHVIPIYEVISTKDNIYIAMERLKGGELYNCLVTRGRLDEPFGRKIFQQLICAIEYCHYNGICHRDLKPENLLLDEENNLRIVDFGLSNSMKDGMFLKTSCGSPNYAAPEVISNELYCGEMVDVWSCGIILYAILCGTLPFNDENIPNLFRLIKIGRYTIPGYVGRGPCELIIGMLKVNPMERLLIKHIKAHRWFRKDLPKYLDVDYSYNYTLNYSHNCGGNMNGNGHYTGVDVAIGRGNININEKIVASMVHQGFGNKEEIIEAVKYGGNLLIPDKFLQVLLYNDNIKIKDKLLRLKELHIFYRLQFSYNDRLRFATAIAEKSNNRIHKIDLKRLDGHLLNLTFTRSNPKQMTAARSDSMTKGRMNRHSSNTKNNSGNKPPIIQSQIEGASGSNGGGDGDGDGGHDEGKVFGIGYSVGVCRTDSDGNSIDSVGVATKNTTATTPIANKRLKLKSKHDTTNDLFGNRRVRWIIGIWALSQAFTVIKYCINVLNSNGLYMEWMIKPGSVYCIMARTAVDNYNYNCVGDISSDDDDDDGGDRDINVKYKNENYTKIEIQIYNSDICESDMKSNRHIPRRVLHLNEQNIDGNSNVIQNDHDANYNDYGHGAACLQTTQHRDQHGVKQYFIIDVQQLDGECMPFLDICAKLMAAFQIHQQCL